VQPKAKLEIGLSDVGIQAEAEMGPLNKTEMT